MKIKAMILVILSVSLVVGYFLTAFRGKNAASALETGKGVCGCENDCDCGCKQTGVCGCQK